MKMEWTLFFLAFTMFWKSSLQVKCYRCNPEHVRFGSPPCSQFNYSAQFIVDCSASTMCSKRETMLDFGDGQVSKSVERGCAPQTFDGDQRRIDGKWIKVQEVYEVYEDACKEYPSDDHRPTKSVHCFCRGDLCNDATSLRTTLGTLFMAITLFLLC